MREHYEIEYARFFNYPKSPSTSTTTTSTSTLVRSLPMSKKQRNRGGTWLSASTAASLHLLPDLSTSPSFPQFVLVVSLRDRIHVSCVSQSPATARGSRVIFASYKDCVGQIQKFAMRFQDSSESLTFVNSLKECLAGVCSIRLPSNNFRSENLSRNEFAAATELHHGLQYTFPLETTVPHEGGVISTLLPTSFTAFLADGCTEAQQESRAVPENVDLTTYIVKYMSGSSFNDMLNKLEKVISDMGDDLSLHL